MEIEEIDEKIASLKSDLEELENIWRKHKTE